MRDQNFLIVSRFKLDNRWLARNARVFHRTSLGFSFSLFDREKLFVSPLPFLPHQSHMSCGDAFFFIFDWIMNRSSLAMRQEKSTKRRHFYYFRRSTMIATTKVFDFQFPTSNLFAVPNKRKCCSKNSKIIPSRRPSSVRAKPLANSKRPLFPDVTSPQQQPFQMSFFQEVSSWLQVVHDEIIDRPCSSRFMCIWIQKVFPSVRSWWNHLLRHNSHNGKNIHLLKIFPHFTFSFSTRRSSH